MRIDSTRFRIVLGFPEASGSHTPSNDERQACQLLRINRLFFIRLELALKRNPVRLCNRLEWIDQLG
jgi:hypothetical protein